MRLKNRKKYNPKPKSDTSLDSSGDLKSVEPKETFDLELQNQKNTVHDKSTTEENNNSSQCADVHMDVMSENVSVQREHSERSENNEVHEKSMTEENNKYSECGNVGTEVMSENVSIEREQRERSENTDRSEVIQSDNVVQEIVVEGSENSEVSNIPTLSEDRADVE